MKRILLKYLPAILLALPLVTLSGLAQAKGLIVDTGAEAEAIQAEFKGNGDYNSLVAVKLTHIAAQEVGEHDQPAARQIMKLADEYAARARGVK